MSSLNGFFVGMWPMNGLRPYLLIGTGVGVCSAAGVLFSFCSSNVSFLSFFEGGS